ncbi:hypothetical protein EP30_10180, partial [Bifidobacterium sp. UTCIF-39]|uniref:hypothetical protein n=1 Tax=Bifidobacterium sp. UTCIF-39 TaxID=1465359 RepID=UPI00112C2069
MDVKSSYSSAAAEQRAEAARRLLGGDSVLAYAFARGRTRTALYKQNWQEVDINEVIARFTPGAQMKKSGVKVHFVDPRGRYEIVADSAGGYLRIQDIRNFPKKKRVFVDLNGNDVRFVLVNGKLERRDKESA